MTKLLIDGDVVAYRCGFAVEQTRYLVQRPHDFQEEFDNAKSAKEASGKRGVIWTRKEVEPVENAIKLVEAVLSDIRQRYSDFDLRIYLSPSGGNFRDGLATRARYKGNRDAAARPVHLPAIREYLLKHFDAEVAHGQEADDSIGIGMSDYPGSISVSIDKDLRQLAGRHYNWVNKEEFTVSKRDAAIHFYTQALAGDSTDNIPGCEGIGPVKAAKLLAGCKRSDDAWKRVVDKYIECHGDDGPLFALETARLVYVRRKPDELWSPPA